MNSIYNLLVAIDFVLHPSTWNSRHLFHATTHYQHIRSDFHGPKARHSESYSARFQRQVRRSNADLRFCLAIWHGLVAPTTRNKDIVGVSPSIFVTHNDQKTIPQSLFTRYLTAISMSPWWILPLKSLTQQSFSPRKSSRLAVQNPSAYCFWKMREKENAI